MFFSRFISTIVYYKILDIVVVSVYMCVCMHIDIATVVVQSLSCV